MVGQISANDLKTRGISAIDELVSENDGVVITVHGKEKYVVLSIAEYNVLRELELEAAIQDAKRDVADERFHSGSVSDHLKRVTDV